MAWIGLREKDGARFEPQGLGAPPGPPPSPDDLLATGTLLIEFRHDRSDTRRNLVRFSTRMPWASSLSLCVDPDGTILLLQAQGERHLSCRLPTDLDDLFETALLGFAWDAPRRTGTLSLWVPDRGALFQTAVEGPLPLSLRDAERIVGLPSLCPLAANVDWLALADRAEPLGPVPSLGPAAQVATPGGPRPVHRLRPGDTVTTADGGTAQVRWSGAQEVPARGRFAPLRLRAPFHGLRHDLLVAPDQRLRIGGSDVEYLFGAEEVSVAARHLAPGALALAEGPRWTVTYHQVLLDRPAALLVNGTQADSFDAAPLLADRALLPGSVLRGLPDALLPRGVSSGIPVLRGFEAMTLGALSAA